MENMNIFETMAKLNRSDHSMKSNAARDLDDFDFEADLFASIAEAQAPEANPVAIEASELKTQRSAPLHTDAGSSEAWNSDDTPSVSENEATHSDEEVCCDDDAIGEVDEVGEVEAGEVETDEASEHHLEEAEGDDGVKAAENSKTKTKANVAAGGEVEEAKDKATTKPLSEAKATVTADETIDIETIDATEAGEATEVTGNTKAGNARGAQSADDKAILKAAEGALKGVAVETSGEADGELAFDAADAEGDSEHESEQPGQKGRTRALSNLQAAQETAKAAISKELPDSAKSVKAVAVSTTTTASPASASNEAAAVSSLNKPATVVQTGDLGRAFVERVSARMAFNFRNNQARATLLLDPPELGNLKVDIVVKNSMMKATILAESTVVKEALESNLATLKQSLANHGLNVDELTVALDDSSGDSFNDWAGFEAGGNDGENKSGGEQLGLPVTELAPATLSVDDGTVDIFI